MSSDARKYAEDKLGVHTVYRELCLEIAKMDDTLTHLDKAQDDKRGLEDAYEYREVELAGEMRGIHPNMTDTRFKSEWKGWEVMDPELIRLRTELNILKGVIQGDEIELEMCRTRIKVGSARLTELGGYLNYLAAVMNQAETSDNTDK
jgi:hypothetical protein